MLVMNVYVAMTNRGNTPNLGCFYCGTCVLFSGPFAMGIFLCIDDPVVDVRISSPTVITNCLELLDEVCYFL